MSLFDRSKKKKLAVLQAQWGSPKNQGFNFDLIQKYFEAKPHKKNGPDLDDRSINDLDLHAFFAYIDRTQSALGQQLLYHNLRYLQPCLHDLEVQEQLVAHYNQQEKERWQTQLLLAQLNSSDDHYFPYMLFGQLPDKPHYFAIFPMLQVLFFASLFLTFIHKAFVLLLALVFGINLLLHYREKAQIGRLAKVFSRLGRLTFVAKKLLPLSPSNTQENNRLRQHIKAVNKVVAKISFLKTDRMQDNEVASLAWYATELLKIATVSEVLTFYRVLDDMAAVRKRIEAIYIYVAEQDIALSIASLRAGLPQYCQPVFLQTAKQIHLEQLVHPLVKDCVPNDLSLQGNSLLLTGSNMSGKSTFIRAINLNVIAAQTLNTAFAARYSAPLLDIASSIRITDNLLDKKSYYMEEVLAIGELLERAQQQGKSTLFTIDEVFKGTNTIERVSAAKAILEFLNQGTHLVLVSTHDIELTQLLESGFQLHCFQEQIEDQELSFDYKLRPGALRKRNAISILEIAGYPSSIIAEARALAEKLEKQKIAMRNF